LHCRTGRKKRHQHIALRRHAIFTPTVCVNLQSGFYIRVSEKRLHGFWVPSGLHEKRRKANGAGCEIPIALCRIC
jgi:hypothetical protein